MPGDMEVEAENDMLDYWEGRMDWNVDVLKVDPIKQYGTQVYIVNTIFGGIVKFRQAIKDLETAIYAA